MPWDANGFREKHYHGISDAAAKVGAEAANEHLRNHPGDEGGAVRAGVMAAKNHGKKNRKHL